MSQNNNQGGRGNGQMLHGIKGIQVDPAQFKNFYCPNCNKVELEVDRNAHFTWVVEVKMVPALLSPIGKPSAMFNQLGLACLECGWEADLQTIANLVEKEMEK